jgi:predicted RNA-binding Zn-ribbon protein involved in translation (DUF1610 family)
MYTVTGKVGGKRIVKFECPACAAPIESPLEEAGQKFPCPSCGNKFVTPGVDELRQQQEAARAKAEAKAQAEAEAEQRKADEVKAKQQKQLEKNKAAAERRSRPPSPLRSAAFVSIITACVVMALFDLFIIRPLQYRLATAEQKLDEMAKDQDHLRDAVNGNTELANRNSIVMTENIQRVDADLVHLSHDLASLTETVKTTGKEKSSSGSP